MNAFLAVQIITESIKLFSFYRDFCNLLDLIEYLRQILAPMTWISCGNGQCTATVYEFCFSAVQNFIV